MQGMVGKETRSLVANEQFKNTTASEVQVKRFWRKEVGIQSFELSVQQNYQKMARIIDSIFFRIWLKTSVDVFPKK